MIIRSDSRLRRLPTAMVQENVLFWDGIRYALSMADLAYLRLFDNLFELSRKVEQASNIENADFHIVSALSDSWSIIDSVHRLRELLQAMPGLKQNLTPLLLFRHRTKSYDDFRNAVQHLRRQIKGLVRSGEPVWGSISWIFFNPDRRDTLYSITLYGGTLYNQLSRPIINPVGRTVESPISQIRLTSYGIEVCLTDTHRHLDELTKFLEQALDQSIQKDFTTPPPTHAADPIVFLQLSISEKPQ